MIDREKVIKGLETCYCPPAKCEDCPYNDIENCNDALCLDALALLKEHETVKKVLADRQCEVSPYHYERKEFCPKCHQEVKLILNRNYCGFCGQEIKWNE